MKVVHHHTRTGAISGNLNMLTFLNTPGNMIYFIFFLNFRFHIEKLSDNGNSKRFDYQDSGGVSTGFMTSTPQRKSQAVFSPPKSYQVGQTMSLTF